MGMDVPSKPHGNVIPVHAGIQRREHGLDSRVRGNDDFAIIWHVCFPEYITRSSQCHTYNMRAPLALLHGHGPGSEILGKPQNVYLHILGKEATQRETI